MSPPCNDHRERLLADHECSSSEKHLGECGECRAWWVKTERLTKALSGLSRLDAPVELAAAVQRSVSSAGLRIGESVDDGELSGDQLAQRLDSDPSSLHPIFEGAFRNLSRLHAPEILDDLVLDPSPLRDSRTATLLSGLSRIPVPQVLDRLVGEELESPARHRVERFIGDLERENVPYALDENPVRSIASRFGRSNRRMLVAPLTAIAAGLILWASFGGGTRVPETTEYSFDVVRVHSPDQLSPLANSFLSGMTGGSRLQPKTDREGSPR